MKDKGINNYYDRHTKIDDNRHLGAFFTSLRQIIHSYEEFLSNEEYNKDTENGD